MPKFNFVLFYVENPPASAKFYAELLGRQAVETTPAFAMLQLSDGVMLGLWSKDTCVPKPAGAPGASEIAFAVADAEAVYSTHQAWTKQGLTIAQEPATMDFGPTFVALDPDGHRLRVLVPGG